MSFFMDLLQKEIKTMEELVQQALKIMNDPGLEKDYGVQCDFKRILRFIKKKVETIESAIDIHGFLN